MATSLKLPYETCIKITLATIKHENASIYYSTRHKENKSLGSLSVAVDDITSINSHGPNSQRDAIQDIIYTVY